MAAGRYEKLVVESVVIAANAGNDRELVLDGIGVLGIGAHLLLAAVEIVETRLRGLDPRRVVGQTLAVILQLRLRADDQRRTVGEVVIVHQVHRQRILVALVVVQTEVGVFVEMVEVGHEREVRTHLVLLVGIVYRGSDGRTYFKIAVRAAVADLRSVKRARLVPFLAHLVAHRILIVEHAAQPVLLHELPAPANLRAVVGGIEPLVGDVELVGQRQVAEPVVVVVHLAHVGVHRTVQQDHARQFLVLGDGKRRRDIGFGTQLVVEVEVHEQPLVVGRLAVFEVDLARDGFMAGRNRGHAFGNLNRIEPHARRVAQAVGGAQAAHDRTVLVENLRIGARKAQHLDLTRARNGVAVPHGHRSRILEALGEVAAGHLAETRERNHLVLDDAVALDEVAAEVALDHNVLQLHAVRPKCEFDPLRAVRDVQRVVHEAQIRSHQVIVTFHAVEQKSSLGVSAGADRGTLPVDRSAHQRLVVGVADHAPQILRAEGAAHSEG